MRQIKKIILLLSIMIVSAMSQKAMSSCLAHDSISYTNPSPGVYIFTAHTGIASPSLEWIIDGAWLYPSSGIDTFRFTFTPGLQTIVLSDLSCGTYDTISIPVPQYCFLHDTISYVDLGGGHYLFTANTTGSGPNPIYEWALPNSTWPNHNEDTISFTCTPGLNHIAVMVQDTAVPYCWYYDSITFIVPSNCTLAGTLSTHAYSSYDSLAVHLTGGTPPYLYAWSNSIYQDYIPYVDVSNNGIYSVTVTDANGCSLILSDTVTGLPCSLQPVISYQYLGAGQYYFTATVTGSYHPGYKWNYDNGSIVQMGTSSSFDYTLPIGNCIVALVVRDSLTGCTNFDSIGINVPSGCTLTGSITQQINGGEGNLTASVSGGSGHYQYIWSRTSDSISANVVPVSNNGIYSVTVTDDSTGCQIVLRDTLTTLTCNMADSISYVDEGGGVFLFTAHTTGSAHPTYAWDLHPLHFLVPGSDTISHTYPSGWQSVAVTIYDTVSHCVLYDSINFFVPSSGCALTGSITQHIFSNGDSLTAMVSGGSGHYQFIWSANANNASDNSVAALTNGIYTVTVTDTTGCRIVLSDTVSGLTNCTLAVSFHNTYGYNSCGVTATVTGANGPLSGGWSGLISYLLANNIDSISINNSGTYCFTISDSAGCVVSACDSISIPACHLTGTLSAISVTAGSDTFEAHVNNGTPPYTYEWASIWGIVSTGTSPVYGIDPPQGVCVKVTDSIGCVIDMCDSPTVNPLGVSDIQDHPVITVVPNPFRDFTTITVSGVDMKDATLEIYTIVGQRVTVSAPAADGVFRLDRGGLSGGIYIYSIRQGDRSIGSGKLVIEQ